jgi:hypothetical protein
LVIARTVEQVERVMRLPLSAEEQALADAVSPERLMDSTRTIARWVRLSGTPEEAHAFDWLEGRLKEHGLAVVRYSFPALVSWPESASLRVTTADGRSEDIHCATHGFATSTPAEGLEGETTYVGRGTEEELAKHDLRGKIVLVDGIAAPNRGLVVEAAGVSGSIWIAGQRLHERLMSPVWGNPTPETAHLLPKTPSISITGPDGKRIKEILAKGPARVRMMTKVFQGWKDIPILTGDLVPDVNGPEARTFVMLSGHVDSWYYGAMDNGSANATMLEVARLLAERRSRLRRGLRVAFWSGHSHGRYAGSALYADHAWQDLHEHCVAHVNVDSTGGKGATVLTEGNSMAEMRSFASGVIEAIAGQQLSPRRFGRSGDQSFWGHGIPSLLMTLSEQPPEAADPVLATLFRQISGGHGKSGGLGWWWHTPEDTVDKIDPEFLRRDTMIYALLAFRLCTGALLPFQYTAVVEELTGVVRDLQGKAGDRFDLSPVAESVAALGSVVATLEQRIAGLQEKRVNDDDAHVVNRCLMEVGRALIPINYTQSGQFDQDLAVPTHPLPALQAVAKLASMQKGSDAYHFLGMRLERERNRVVHGILSAIRATESALHALERDRRSSRAAPSSRGRRRGPRR